MLVRLGPTDLDPALRPIVLAAASSIACDQPLETSVKQAVGQGADLVEVPAARLEPSNAAARRDVGARVCVRCERLDEVDGALDHGAVAVRWTGDAASIEAVRDRLGPVALVVPRSTVSGENRCARATGGSSAGNTGTSWRVVP